MILVRLFMYTLSFSFCLINLVYCNEPITPWHSHDANHPPHIEREKNLNNSVDLDEITEVPEDHEGMDDIFSYDQGDRFKDIEKPKLE